MNLKNKKLYVSFVKKRYPKLSEMMIEKEYYLSLFLTKISIFINKNSSCELNNLLFKGGTLLSKYYLNYHRLSEDLDFCYSDSNRLRTLSTSSKLEKKIKSIEIKLIDNLVDICKGTDFDFKDDRSKTSKYINIINKRKICVFYIYYKSDYISINESRIKIEVNFIEDRLHNPKNVSLLNIVDKLNLTDLDKVELASFKFDLEKINFKSYDIYEIILEKYRALLTRKENKERDVFDLYLINKKHDILNINIEDVYLKLKSIFVYFSIYKDNYNYNLKSIKSNNFKFSDNLDDMVIEDYNLDEYNQFKANLLEKLKLFKYIK
ncbi:nucleotidyl transferase AbiEii/AbiGii toxin family protein [archaeon]|jgi:predicted nucleotidyltransferase component of viral defense system|nr:nucleotidyl transferase AbiEii/AbiGii toxin family protein [archaeon]MDD2477955.1 nucleotidyl transferase AbiEii/AbiGii toxin family protein [Candidatus ainarchaeum sp.]MDD3084949.1 nucleotidyl transferase AbiEii/AbiGii toxin family protein [Candidatus ainarchaeum sp.]